MIGRRSRDAGSLREWDIASFSLIAEPLGNTVTARHA